VIALDPSYLTLGQAQWRPAPGRHAANLEQALAHVATLAGRGADLVCLPELWPCGYDPRTLADDARTAAEPLDGPRGTALAEAAREHGVWLFAGTVPELDGERLRNTAVVYDPAGRLRAAHRKVHLYHPLGEDVVFAAGTSATVVELDGLGTVGLSTCFDGDRPSYARELRRLGATLVISASAYEVGASTWWDVLYPANALVNGQWWVMTNQCGGEGDAALLGASRVIAPDGSTVVQGVRWDEPGRTDGTDLLVTTVDLTAGSTRADQDSSALWLGPDGTVL
jgi:predicted amidohydrolase